MRAHCQSDIRRGVRGYSEPPAATATAAAPTIGNAKIITVGDQRLLLPNPSDVGRKSKADFKEAFKAVKEGRGVGPGVHSTESENADVGTNGRLFVRNLPYTATEVRGVCLVHMAAACPPFPFCVSEASIRQVAPPVAWVGGVDSLWEVGLTERCRASIGGTRGIFRELGPAGRRAHIISYLL